MARVFNRHLLRPTYQFPPSPSRPSSFSSSSSYLPQRQSETVSLPQRIAETLLKTRTLSHLSQIHALLITSGYTQKPFFAAKLLNLSSELKDLNYTLAVFRNVNFVNRVCVNAVIRAYSASSVTLQGVIFYFQMLKVGFVANSFTFPSLLSCCARSGCAASGQKCHGQAIKRGFEDVVEIQNIVIHMYGCFGLIDMAAQVFDEMPHRDLVSWHSFIGAVFNAGDVLYAHKLLDIMPVKNVVSWNVMMTGYLENNNPGFVLKLFRKMQETSLMGNARTIISVLTACGRSARLKEGMSVHGFLIRRKLDMNLIVYTAAIDMYSKCRKVQVARTIFDSVSEKNLVSWNSMILGYCLHGDPKHGLKLFGEMVHKIDENARVVGFSPDAITFVGVLCACNRASLLGNGRDYFHQMVHKFRVKPNFAHYWCMANLLANSGLTEEALEIARKVDEFNSDLSSESVIWALLLGLCRFEGNVLLGERVANTLIELEPRSIVCYALLFNVYAVAGRWDDVCTLKETIRMTFGEKIVGCRLIDLIDIVHELALEKSSKDEVNKVMSTDELFQRQDLSCLLSPQLHNHRHDTIKLGSEG